MRAEGCQRSAWYNGAHFRSIRDSENRAAPMAGPSFWRKPFRDAKRTVHERFVLLVNLQLGAFEDDEPIRCLHLVKKVARRLWRCLCLDRDRNRHVERTPLRIEN